VVFGPDGEYHWTEKYDWPEGGDEPRPATALEKGLLQGIGGNTGKIREGEIIRKALFDMLDALGALTNPSELDHGRWGYSLEDEANLLEARALVRGGRN
jgi:hypothetical protein